MITLLLIGLAINAIFLVVYVKSENFRHEYNLWCMELTNKILDRLSKFMGR